MAVRHRLIKTDPSVVWDVIADGSRYADWVVGTGASRPNRGRWPEKGASIEYEVPLGPWRLSNETIVRRCEEGRQLELEILAGPLGTARFSIELREWGEYCLVIADEHPLQGAGGALHNFGAEAVIQLRHRTMLARLARCCEEQGEKEAEQAEQGHEPAARGLGVQESPGHA
ncbi:SRPBCC family protein [Streptomyces longwoodensis]|uniref:SRPBCC family protein n=1 Tax=Streptomyces longwoodensis TaxID=68231 RepID=UPI003403FB1D